MPSIPLVAEFGTDHTEKTVLVISVSIFSENVGGMRLKFGEEILKITSINNRGHSMRFSVFWR